MLRSFYGGMSFSDSIESISILHESDEYVVDDSEIMDGMEPTAGPEGSDTENQKYIRVKTYHDESDIWDTIEKGDYYRFLKGDYLKVTVREQNVFSLFPALEDNTVTVVYGGCIKYETD